MVSFELILAVILVGLLLVASATDARSRIIPNWVNISIAAIAIPFWWTTHLTLWPGLAIQLAVAASVFTVMLWAFNLGQMGGGDVKLLTALALFLPPLDFLDAFFGTAMVGGILTSVQLVRHTLTVDERPFENPYGISISIGALIALGGRYGLLPEAKVMSALMPLAIVCCLGALIFRLSRRHFAAR